MKTPAPLRIAERELRLYRRIWRENAIGAFVQPFLYLLGVGVGVGSSSTPAVPLVVFKDEYEGESRVRVALYSDGSLGDHHFSRLAGTVATTVSRWPPP